MTTPDLPDWLTVGAEVRTWRGSSSDAPGPVKTVTRTTKTLAILDDGSRWNLTRRTRVGATSYLELRTLLYRADDPRLLAAEHARETESARSSAAYKVAELANIWAHRGHGSDDDTATRLRAAIVALAPHLGLAVTDPDAVDPVEKFRCALIEHFRSAESQSLGLGPNDGAGLVSAWCDVIADFQPEG